MNLPNKLTVSRFALTVVFLWALFWPSHVPFRYTFALVFFCLAGVTDFLDGRIARARNLITNFGILMDPLADKIMTCSAFIAFVESTHLHPDAPVKVGAWMVVIIVARELAITGLRLLAASKNIVLAAERYGKHKTISQIVAIIALLVVDAGQGMAGGVEKSFCRLDADVRRNHAVDHRRADGVFRHDLSLAQPRAVFGRHVMRFTIGDIRFTRGGSCGRFFADETTMARISSASFIKSPRRAGFTRSLSISHSIQNRDSSHSSSTMRSLLMKSGSDLARQTAR